MKPFMFVTGVLFLLFSSCTSTRITTSWKDPQLTDINYKNIIVVALMEGVKNRELRVYLENHMAEDLSDMGYNARSATAVYGPKSLNEKSEKEVIDLIRTDGYDAIITVTVLDIEKEDNYVRGTIDYWPGGIYYTRFGRYYTYWYQRVYQPGYYITSTKYLVEGNLFDVKTDKLVYSAQTETIDPGTLDNLGHNFSIRLLKNMKEKGVLK